MNIHVLAGDSLKDEFEKCGFDGDVIVCRECLIEGDLSGENLEEFWKTRAKFIVKNYGASEREYRTRTVEELSKLRGVAENAEVNLWFENELFCQANMWFCLSLLNDSKAEVFRTAPIVKGDKNIWQGFSKMGAEDLRKCFRARTKFTENDKNLGANL